MKENNFEDILNELMHTPQPHTILGKRGQQEANQGKLFY